VGPSGAGGSLATGHQQAGMPQPLYKSPHNYKLYHLHNPSIALPHADPHASGYFLEAPLIVDDLDGSTQTC
jgi:hypothetical protein